MRTVTLLFLIVASAHATIASYGTAQKNWTNTGVTHTVNVPNGGTTVTADTLVCVAAATYDASPGTATPAGYTVINQLAVGSLDHLDVYCENYANGATLPTTLSVSYASGGGSWMALVCWAYQGHNSSFLDGTAQTLVNTSSSATVAGPSITTAAANEMVVWVFYGHGDEGIGTNTISQGSKAIELTRNDSSANQYELAANNLQASAGSSGANTLTWTNSLTPSAAITFAIKPAAGGVTMVRRRRVLIQ